GAEVTEKVLGEAEPLMRFVLERSLQGAALDTPGSKAKAVSATAAILAWEPNRVARSDYVFWLARRIGVDPLQIQQEVSEVQSDPNRAGPATRIERLPGHVKVEREALALVIDSPAELKRVSTWVTGDHFTVAEHRVILNVLLEYSRSTEGTFMDGLPDDETRRLAAELALSQLTTQDPEEVFLRLEEFRLRRQIASLRTKLDRLDPDMDPDGYAELFAELMKLDEQRRRFDLR
ncbi:MAG TPA: hypothetical protein VI541_01090, partial [Actinomycetota bacterium]|nr:hypothetical protein [Actinomycetota bacterium]